MSYSGNLSSVASSEEPAADQLSSKDENCLGSVPQQQGQASVAHDALGERPPLCHSVEVTSSQTKKTLS